MDSRHLIVGGSSFEPPAGLRVSNWTDGSTFHFTGDRRDRTISEIIFHESVTASAAGAVNVLRRRGYGVHLVVDPAGKVTQHADLAFDRLIHAGGHNGPSIGLEFVNLYYGAKLRKYHPWTQIIRAPWAHKKLYIVLTLAQLEAGAAIVRWATSLAGTHLAIPRRWIGLQADGRGRARMRMGRVPGADVRVPGIYAHHYFHHSDGAFPVLYAFLRLEAELAPVDAYAETIRLATGKKTRAADLREYSEACARAFVLA